MTTRLRGPLSGQGYLPTGGNPGDTLIKTTDVDGECAWSPAGSFNVKSFGAVGDGSTDDTTRIQQAIDEAEEAGAGIIHIPAGTFNITASLTITKPIIFEGVGCTTGVTAGSVLKNISQDVPAIIVSGANTNAAQRCVFRDFGIIHQAPNKFAIEISNGAYAKHENVVINCGGLGKGGFLAGSDVFVTTADLGANEVNAWQCIYDHCVVHDAVGSCFKANTDGHTIVYRDCTPRTNVPGARGFDISTNNVHIKGGQVAATGAGGKPISFFNRRTGALRGGSVEDIRFEGVGEDCWAVEIDGSTNLFFDIELRRLAMNLGDEEGGLVRFGRAQACWLRMPDIASPTGGGLIAEYGANSESCGIEVDFQAARAALTVDAAATLPTKVVYGVMSSADISDIEVASNLTTIVLHGVIEQPGVAVVHDGSSWTI